jgi:lysophospholipase L1-like esterase
MKYWLIFFALGLPCCAGMKAQNPAPESTCAQQGMQAVQSLESYREQMIPKLLHDFGDLARYRAADAQLGTPAPNEERVVFFGDSITDIWNLETSFPGRHYVNRGISGQTTPQMLVRFREDAIDLHPAAVLILAGTNDIAGNTGPETPAEIEANLASMAELARVHGIRVVLSSITPVNGSKPEWLRFALMRPAQEILDINQWIRRYCQENGIVYLDYFAAMVNDQGLMKPDLTKDGLHPNAAGFAVMAPLAQAAITKALGQPVVVQP